MSYLLRFDGVNDNVRLDNNLSLGTVGDYLEIDLALAAGRVTILGSYTSGYGSIFERQADESTWRLRSAASGTVYTLTAPSASGRTTVRIQKTATGYELFFDGVSQGEFADTGVFQPNMLGGWAGGAAIDGEWDLYYLTHNQSSVDVSTLDPSATGGVGSVLEDTAGTNDGTLTNFPTNNSQWLLAISDWSHYVTIPESYSPSSSITG